MPDTEITPNDTTSSSWRGSDSLAALLEALDEGYPIHYISKATLMAKLGDKYNENLLGQLTGIIAPPPQGGQVGDPAYLAQRAQIAQTCFIVRWEHPTDHSENYMLTARGVELLNQIRLAKSAQAISESSKQLSESSRAMLTSSQKVESYSNATAEHMKNVEAYSNASAEHMNKVEGFAKSTLESSKNIETYNIFLLGFTLILASLAMLQLEGLLFPVPTQLHSVISLNGINSQNTVVTYLPAASNSVVSNSVTQNALTSNGMIQISTNPGALTANGVISGNLTTPSGTSIESRLNLIVMLNIFWLGLGLSMVLYFLDRHFKIRQKIGALINYIKTRRNR